MTTTETNRATRKIQLNFLGGLARPTYENVEQTDNKRKKSIAFQGPVVDSTMFITDKPNHEIVREVRYKHEQDLLGCKKGFDFMFDVNILEENPENGKFENVIGNSRASY